jgi:phosphate transport system protein
MPILENPTPHIFHKFDTELEDIRSRVMAMGGLVEQQLSDALYALVNGDGALAENVVANDYKINRMDVEIDATCTHVLARRQPIASDLRLVLAVIKTINDLERIGDESKHIGRIGLRLAENPHGRCRISQIEHMGNRVKRMLHQSLDALARGDVDQAIEVALEDKKVDRDHEAVMRQMLTYMMEDPRNIPEITELCWSARALERVGDRSRNICEYVIYLVKGKDVRHVNLEHLADEIVAS